MMNQVKKFFKEEEGQGMTEYGLILGGIAVVAVVALTTMGDNITTKLNDIAAKIINPKG